MALARPLLLLLALLGLTTAVPIPAPAAAPIGFWNVPRHGGNSFNGTPPDQAYFDALAGYGSTWVRLVYDKWTPARRDRSEEHTSELQSLMRISYAVFCLQKKNHHKT